MAYKSFKNLTPRNQSSLVTQLHKLIHYYGEIFCSRERAYIKSLSQQDGSIYWLEDDLKKIIAVAIVDHNFTIKTNDLEIIILGHTISKRPGQMDRILHHIWSDYEDRTIAVLSRRNLSTAFDQEDLQLVELTVQDLIENWSELANYTTGYFNLSNEKLVEGLIRKDYCLFIKFCDKDLRSLKENNSQLYDLIVSKQITMKETVS